MYKTHLTSNKMTGYIQNFTELRDFHGCQYLNSVIDILELLTLVSTISLGFKQYVKYTCISKQSLTH